MNDSTAQYLNQHGPLEGSSLVQPNYGRRELMRHVIAGAGLVGAGISPVFAQPQTRLRLTAGGQPVARRLSYDGNLVTGFGTTRVAKAKMQFTPNADQYRMVLEVRSMLADLVYSSTGRIDEFGLSPVNYVEHRKVAFKSRRVKKVQYVVTDDPAAINRREGDKLYVPPGTQDRLSLMLQVSMLARAYPNLMASKQPLAIPFARITAVAASQWQAAQPANVAIDGTEGGLSSSGRQRLAQKISRVADSKESVDVSFWLTDDADRLPLILQFTESGRSLRFVAKV